MSSRFNPLSSRIITFMSSLYPTGLNHQCALAAFIIVRLTDDMAQRVKYDF